MSASDYVLLVLGAGLGRRFGKADKLNASLDGRPVAHHVLDAINNLPWSRKRLVCRVTTSWQKAFRQSGFECLVNTRPERGLGSSLALGIEDLSRETRLFVCLADMPKISVGHIAALIATGALLPDCIIASTSEQYCGPPAILPLHLLDGFDASGDKGARRLMQKAHPVYCDMQTLCDVDDRATLDRLNGSS